jgi:hypothetical protein
MPSDASLVLAAVKAALNAVYPDSEVAVRTSKRPAAGARNGLGGLQAGLPLPAFVVSATDEVNEALSTFEHVCVMYAVTLEYVKAAQAKVTGAVDAGASPLVVEDEDVREKRAAMRQALYPTLSAVPGAFHTKAESLPPYEATPEGQATALVSGERFTYYLMEARP